MQIVNNRQIPFVFQFVHKLLLGGKQIDSGDSTFSTQTKITVVSFLFVGNKTNRVDFHRRNIPEQTLTAHILSVDYERRFFAADSTAFLATDGCCAILHCDIP
jgi:hypothetical protein